MATSECGPDNAPKIDTLLDTLSHRIRREVIRYFESVSGTATADLDTLVSHVDEQITEVPRDELQVSLRHIHLPKLQTRGWLDHDSRSDHVRYYGQESPGQLIAEVADLFDD